MRSGQATESEVADWCIGYLQRTIDDASVVISADASFAEMGLDSASSTYFIVELEEWLGIELEPELVFEHPTIAALARHIANRTGGGFGASA